MIKIILVRHGETDWNKMRRFQGGASDIPLNTTGLSQADRIALKLKNEKLLAIYSSPLQRALNTAQSIARYHSLEINQVPSLKEIHVGSLEGELSATFPQRFDELICRNKHLPLTENEIVECIDDVQKRAWDTINQIFRSHNEGTVVIVTHYFVILTVVCRVLNLPLNQLGHLRSTPGSLTIFTMDEKGDARLELFNDSCHFES